MAETSPILVKDIVNPTDSSRWMNLNRIKNKETTPIHIIIKYLKNKDKKKSKPWKEIERNVASFYITTDIGTMIWMTVDFSSETMEARWKRHIFLSAKKKKKKNKTANSAPSMKISFRSEWNQDIFIWRKTRRICLYLAYPKRMVKGSSPNKKKMLKEEILEHQERKTTEE